MMYNRKLVLEDGTVFLGTALDIISLRDDRGSRIQYRDDRISRNFIGPIILWTNGYDDVSFNW